MKSIKSIIPFILIGLALSVTAKPNKLVVQADSGKVTISKNIYGHFAEHLGNCIYGGFWVGPESNIPNTRGIRNDVIAALKEIDPPVIRWPGGCFADYYHWKDGIGPRDQRPTMINSSWGGVTEDNSFGTHEFLDLCEILGAEPYVCVNVGSGTVQEAADWVEYINSSNISPMTDLRKKNGREKPWNVKYFAVGNESWGCGGNMTPEYYVDNFKRFATYMRAGDLYRVASGGIDPDYHWTETVMKKTENCRQLIDGYSFHYYSVWPSWNDKGLATDFKEQNWFNTLRVTHIMEGRLEQHIDIMNEYDPGNKIGLIADEWGTWYNVEPGTNPGFLYQQNTLRDAVTAAVFLNIFNNHAERVKMANIAQTVNVLQAMVLTKGEKLVKTPTFYVFKMFKVHQDATLLPIALNCEDYSFEGETIPSVTASASKDAAGKIHLSLSNANPHKAIELDVDIQGVDALSKSKGEVITSENMNDYNDFDGEKVNVQPFKDFSVKKNKVQIELPAKSVVTIELD